MEDKLRTDYYKILIPVWIYNTVPESMVIHGKC